MRSTVSVGVAAPAAVVFALAREIERWPALLPHYLRVRALERSADGSLVAEMLAIRTLVPIIGLGVPVIWRARTWDEPETRRMRFVHRGGATAGMDVTWRIESTPSGCRVSIEHDFQPNLPAPVAGAWAVAIDRLFVRPIAARTLATFKAIAEAAAGDWSDLVSPANPSR
jgi:ribosome-associated toxin RatA of RatAB toxin-antitoxin module